MGTSSRRINRKIKELLEKFNPETVEQAIPTIVPPVLRVKGTNKFFSDEFTVAIGIGVKGATVLSNREPEEDLPIELPVTSDPISIERFIEAIIEFVGEDAFEEESPVKPALKYALTESVKTATIENKIFIFLREFCYCLLYLLISTQAAEALSEHFSSEAETNLDNKLKQVARKITEDHLINEIIAYNASSITLDTLIESVTKKVESIKVSDL